MNEINTDLVAAKKCIEDSLRLIGSNSNEQVVRDSFTSHLRNIFPGSPAWVEAHIHGSEKALKIYGKKTGTGFVDNLVSLTAIEYESNLTVPAKFEQGIHQVRTYCASLINEGHDPGLVLGVLSDTVRWFAFNVEVKPQALPLTRKIGAADIQLIEAVRLDCSAATEKEAADLTSFLITYLGRLGARPVSAEALVTDLGFGSRFASSNIKTLSNAINNLFNKNKKYAALIADLWNNFVGYLHEAGQPMEFDVEEYADEFYILLLGKLICANYINEKALSSDDTELKSILNGQFFENLGLRNFVEYDYFGWLNSDENVDQILVVARNIQQDLRAYNFTKKASEDLFGKLMAQLANRSQRILLGQEWTPAWLSKRLVTRVIGELPEDAPLRLVDMCCGSGSMIVETVYITKQRMAANTRTATSNQRFNALLDCVTGFDIDPLAVMLSKINWVLSALDWLQPLGQKEVHIPVYHADSLFAVTPVSSSKGKRDKGIYTLNFAGQFIELPVFLFTPNFRGLFDPLLSMAYEVAKSASAKKELKLDETEARNYVNGVLASLSIETSGEQLQQLAEFFHNYVIAIDQLNREGRNGIWSYILRNSFRPGLLSGQFNGLISNVPWLALSKLAQNPYEQVLKNKAVEFNIKPPASSHLHIELATIFLLHAIKEYLVDGAFIGCIVPETVLNGHHHNPFRTFQFKYADEPVNFRLQEIWEIPADVFKNNAIVLLGQKSSVENPERTFPGKLISQYHHDIPITFYRNQRGSREVWSQTPVGEREAGFYKPANFRQGADIMPRTTFFYEVSGTGNPNQLKVESIDIGSPKYYLISEAKSNRGFRLTQRILPGDVFFDVLISNHLMPFHLAPPDKALLPLRKDANNVWQCLNNAEVLLKGKIVKNTFDAIGRELGNTLPPLETIFSRIDFRGKLSQQIIEPQGYLVCTGAGGTNVCAAYVKASSPYVSRLIIDQTIYWTQVPTEDEAIYLTGLLNSNAINLIIRESQPRGVFGARHIHKLPFAVTPPFNVTEAAHQSVVKQTRALLKEYRHVLRGNATLRAYLDPDRSRLLHRRRRVQSAIQQLSSYRNYEDACISLYGL